MANAFDDETNAPAPKKRRLTPRESREEDGEASTSTVMDVNANGNELYECRNEKVSFLALLRPLPLRSFVKSLTA